MNMNDPSNAIHQPAYPVGSDLGPASNIVQGGYGGMTKLEAFTMAAMQGICANPTTTSNQETITYVADLAVEQARATLAALEREGK